MGDVHPSSARWTHVALPCHDLGATLDWYARFTPLSVLDRRSDDHGEAAWLGHADQPDHPFILVLVCPKGARRAAAHPGAVRPPRDRGAVARRRRPHRPRGRGGSAACSGSRSTTIRRSATSAPWPTPTATSSRSPTTRASMRRPARSRRLSPRRSVVVRPSVVRAASQAFDGLTSGADSASTGENRAAHRRSRPPCPEAPRAATSPPAGRGAPRRWRSPPCCSCSSAATRPSGPSGAPARDTATSARRSPRSRRARSPRCTSTTRASCRWLRRATRSSSGAGCSSPAWTARPARRSRPSWPERPGPARWSGTPPFPAWCPT